MAALSIIRQAAADLPINSIKSNDNAATRKPCRCQEAAQAPGQTASVAVSDSSSRGTDEENKRDTPYGWVFPFKDKVPLNLRTRVFTHEPTLEEALDNPEYLQWLCQTGQLPMTARAGREKNNSRDTANGE